MLVPMNRRNLIVFLLCCVCVLSGLAWQRARTNSHAVSVEYFQNILKAQSLETSVWTRGAQYHVANGIVTKDGHPVSEEEAFAALQTAYRLAIAERTPLFGIAGVDPQKLDAAVSDLQSARRSLAHEQSSIRESQLIYALYPVDFLRSLAALETTRQKFISSHSSRDAELYDEAMRRTIAAGSRDAALFYRALSEALGSKKSFRIPGLGGSITRDRLFSAASQLRTRILKQEDLFKKRQECLGGRINTCSLSNTGLRYNGLATSTTQADISDLQDIQTLWAEAGLTPGPGTTVLLTESACTAMHPPYIYFLFNPGAGRTPLRYVGDIFFNITDGSKGPTLSYLKEKYDIDYSFQNQVQSYICPDVGTDLGMARATAATAQFAARFPALSPEKAAPLLGAPVVQESDAASYMLSVGQELMAQAYPSRDATEAFKRLLLLWREKSAGLDDLVRSVALVAHTDAELHAKGVPIDVDAQTMFITHSAFPSLFLTQNPYAGPGVSPIRDKNAEDFQAYLSSVASYNTLRSTVPRGKIIHDLQAFSRFENGQ